MPAIAYDWPWQFLAFIAFAIGAVVGSFLNVVVHRYPRDESVVFPASRCPNCHALIRWHDNVPILGWLSLGGRCRDCRVPISPRYPLVELANALFYLAVFERTGLSFTFVPIAALISMTIVLIFIDAEIQILPNVITYPGVLVGFAIGALPPFDESMLTSDSILASAIGAAVGAGFLLFVALAYKLVRRIEGMGYGDVKMMAMVGAALGWEGVFLVILVGSIIGTVIGVPVALRTEKRMQYPLPFGVFLGLGTFVILFFGRAIEAAWAALLLPR
ncbi:MAG TPA: prepilin peptidase [Thermoanaerobaculia bacterium]|nr:prepilin peptidase [Thermoanaerobaculia bacterium]